MSQKTPDVVLIDLPGDGAPHQTSSRREIFDSLVARTYFWSQKQRFYYLIHPNEYMKLSRGLLRLVLGEAGLFESVSRAGSLAEQKRLEDTIWCWKR